MNPLAIWKAASLLQRIGVSIGILIALVGAWKLFWWQYDRSVIQEHDAAVTAETLATDSAAKIEAAERRATDTATIAAEEKERNDEIQKATDSGPSAASIRLNCERLRRAGKDTGRITACAGLSR